mmetsp:Transcript_82028/g.206378  ORF Transcript_82028/g.206378 Transcript_82028/m.206378 type:complete len:423 (-) Transcript_82028:51-1319(-)
MRAPRERQVTDVGTLQRHLHRKHGLLRRRGRVGVRRGGRFVPLEGLREGGEVRVAVQHVRAKHHADDKAAKQPELGNRHVLQEVELGASQDLEGCSDVVVLVDVAVVVEKRLRAKGFHQEVVAQPLVLVVVHGGREKPGDLHEADAAGLVLHAHRRRRAAGGDTALGDQHVHDVQDGGGVGTIVVGVVAVAALYLAEVAVQPGGVHGELGHESQLLEEEASECAEGTVARQLVQREGVHLPTAQRVVEHRPEVQRARRVARLSGRRVGDARQAEAVAAGAREAETRLRGAFLRRRLPRGRRLPVARAACTPDIGADGAIHRLLAASGRCSAHGLLPLFLHGGGRRCRARGPAADAAWGGDQVLLPLEKAPVEKGHGGLGGQDLEEAPIIDREVRQVVLARAAAWWRRLRWRRIADAGRTCSG